MRIFFLKLGTLTARSKNYFQCCYRNSTFLLDQFYQDDVFENRQKKEEAETHSALCDPNPPSSCWDFRLARLHLSGKFIQSYLPGLLVNQDQWQRIQDEKLFAGMPSEPTMIVLTEGHRRWGWKSRERVLWD